MIGWLLVIALLAGLAVTAALLARHYLHQRDEVARVRALFSRYVPQQIVDELLERRDPRLFEAREYYATIISARIRNFGLLTEGLTAEQTLRYLNEFYAVAVQAIHRHRGMIESLRGDTVTGVFGVLVDETFQEERALRAALDIALIARSMKSRWQTQGRKPLDVCVGVNSGRIVAGDAGSPARREFAIVGNPAQVADRLAGLAEEINAAVLASDLTFNATSEMFIGVPVSSLPLRGLKKLQRAVIVRGLAKKTSEDLLTVPSERAIAKTVIVANPPPLEPEPVPYAPAEISPEMQIITASPDDEILEGVLVDGFGLDTESGFSMIDDDTAAFPELPAATGTYEDDQGPPVHLNP